MIFFLFDAQRILVNLLYVQRLFGRPIEQQRAAFILFFLVFAFYSQHVINIINYVDEENTKQDVSTDGLSLLCCVI